MEKRLEDLETLLDLAVQMTGVKDVQRLLELIVASATRLVEADRTSLFLLEEDGSLWTRVAERSEPIRLRPGWGIAGLVARTGETVSIPDAYEDPRFSREVDRQTGYRTRSILCLPLRDPSGEVLGVIEAMNKRGDAAFDEDDEERLRALCSHAALAIASQRWLDGERARQKAASEMDVARRIQVGLLPRTMPAFRGFRFAAWQETADQTGGDYYDLIAAAQGSFDLLVCDVSGHGVASALLMTATRAYLRALHLGESNPEKLMERLNKLLIPDMPPDAFVTMTLLRLADDGTACYVAAGHCPPLVFRTRAASFELYEETDLLLGFRSGIGYRAHPIDELRQGDLVVLLTDGLYELTSPDGTPWGLDNVMATIASSAKQGADEVVAALRAGAQAHRGPGARQDDITVLVAQKT